MSLFRSHLRACAAALWLAVATAWGAVEINDVQVTNVGTTTFTVVWTTSEVSTAGLDVFADSAGTNAITATLGLEFYPIAEGDRAVVNDYVARGGRRALEALVIARRVVSVRVTGLVPGTPYYLRPRTFGAGGVDNGASVLPLTSVMTARFTSFVVDGRLARVRFPALAAEGMMAVVQGPAGTAPLSAIVGDSAPADSAVFPLAALLDTTTGTNALFAAPQAITVRLLGHGAPPGTFTKSVNFGPAFSVATYELIEADQTSPAPLFTTQPVNQTVVAGGTATFTAVASGTPAPTYKWQRKPAGSATWADLVNGATYSGVATATLSVGGATADMTGEQFRSIATNGIMPDATSEAATLTVNPAVTPPLITSQPQPVAVVTGQDASFTVVATGDPAPTYQWRRNGLNLPGATAATLALTSVSFDLGGQYSVVVTNSGGSVTSNEATLTVNPVAPAITSALTASGVVGRTFIYQIIAATTQAAYGAAPLPDGLVLDAGTGVISGVPTTATGASPASVVLTATNVTGSDTKTLLLTIQPPPPVITSPAATVGRAGTAFSFTVTATNSPTSFAASGLPPGLALDTASGAITGTPTLPGVFSASVTASNATGDITSLLSILIEAPLNAPAFVGSSSLSAVQGAAFSFAPVFANGPFLGFSATGLPANLVLDSATGVISGPPAATGTFTIQLTATNAGGSTTIALTLTVNPAPTAPVITSASTASAVAGTFFTFTITADPPAGATFAATGLPALGLSLTGVTGVISGTPSGPGTLSLQVNATNSVGAGPLSALVISIRPAATAPVLTSAPAVFGRVGDALTYSLTGTNVDGSTTFAITAGALPPGLTLDGATGVVSGTPTQVGRTGVWFAATNSSGTGLALEVVFDIAPALAMPVITSNGTAAGQVGQPFQYLITATNSPTSFGASGLPAGLGLDTATGVISGLPSSSTATAATVILTATNASGTSVPKDLVVTIAPAPATPLITSALSANGQVGATFSYQITATEAPTSFVASSLPAGLRVAPDTGLITGTPSQAGSFNVTLQAANLAGLGAPSTLAVNLAPAPQAPVITSAASASGKVGAAVAFSYAIVAAPGPITGYGLEGTLPLGLSFNSSTGIISGQPAQPGVFVVQLTATSAVGTSLPQALAINIAPADSVPVITSPNFASGTVGADFSYQITASNPPLLTLDAVNLPPGLAVNPATGLIQGRPTTVGTFTATLVGTNAAGSGPFRELTIEIQPALAAPVITLLGGGLVPARVGLAFSYQIRASNNPTSYEVLGAPEWMTINGASGALGGTPTEPGTFTMQLLARNATGASRPVALLLNVAAAPGAPVITSSHTAMGFVGAQFNYRITATNNPSGFRVRGLPAGLVFDSTTGVISGRPAASGVFKVTLGARNASGLGNPVVLVIVVSPNLRLVLPGF